MKLITIIAALLLACAAFADVNQNHECQGGHNCNNDGGMGQQDQEQFQGQAQGQAQGQGQGQDQEQTATATATQDQANAQSVTFTSPDKLTIRNVPSLSSPNAYPTSPCRIAVSGGLVFAGGGASAGGSIEDPGCTLREDARTFSELGVPAMGLYLMCTQAESVNGQRTKKGKLEKNQPTVPMGSVECLAKVKLFQNNTANDTTITKLRRENERLAAEKMMIADEFDQYRADCDETNDRIFEKCVSK